MITKINPVAKLLRDKKYTPKVIPNKKKKEESERKKEEESVHDYDSYS
jgi:hypothetical protein